MRAILALGLLITLCASANAATVNHHRRHAVVYPNQGLASDPLSGYAYAPAGPPLYAPAGPPIRYLPAPESDQPSLRDDGPFKNWGG